MRYVVLAVAAVLIAVRVWRRRRRSPGVRVRPRSRLRWDLGGVVGLVAEREIRERFRSRVFKVGTAVILIVVAAGVVVPALRHGHRAHERVGVVGALSGPLRTSLVSAGSAVGVQLTLVPEASVASADADLEAASIDVAIVDARRLIVDRALPAGDTSGSALVARAISGAVSLQGGLEAAGIPPSRAAALAHPPPLPVTSLQPARSNGTARITALYGLILLYVLLSQYGTWIMMGVAEEKASRVVEVLLSTLRPPQLLAGKVIGIGTLALAQAVTIVAVAFALAAAVGSDLVRGAAPGELLAILAWLVLGYSFYCWVYAAGGALADRQEHVQTLAFPLQVPILFGYITSLTALGSSNPSTFIHVLGYLPPTAPFAMSVLVADGAATWWSFALSAALTVAATAGIARLAAGVYARAVLRTGRRVRVREVLFRPPA